MDMERCSVRFFFWSVLTRGEVTKVNVRSFVE